MSKRPKIDNKAAWEQLKKEGLVVDAQVHDDGEVWMGFVHKDRTFWHGSGIFKKKYHNADVARRDSRAVARAVSRETGVPLHHSIPAERFKQVPSHTKDRALLQWEFDARQREAEDAYWESPRGVLILVVAFVLLSALGIGGCLFAAWLPSALGMG
jgi:hypothetical protein